MAPFGYVHRSANSMSLWGSPGKLRPGCAGRRWSPTRSQGYLL